MASPSKTTSIKGILPVTNLWWIAEKSSEEKDVQEQNEFLQHYFPEATIEKIKIEATENDLLQKKLALLYHGWSENKQLDNIGVVCQAPIGFSGWSQFVEFVRADPPAFLWRMDERARTIPKTILLPIDFSSGTSRMIPIIKRLAAITKNEKIILLNLFDYSHPGKNDPDEGEMKREKISELQWYLEANIEEEIRNRLDLDAIPKVGEDTSFYLDEYIKNQEIDLVVMGSHNFNHYHYLLYGSTVVNMLNRQSPAHICILF